MILIQEQL